MLRVRVVWSGIGGTPYLTTFWNVGTTQTDADDAVTAVGVLLGAIDALCDNGVNWQSDPEVQVIVPATGLATGSFATTPVGGTGAQSSSNLPFASQGLVRLRTGVFVNGREIRGRHFIPGLVAGSSTDGVVTSSTQTTINAAYLAYLGASAPAPSIWSRTNGQQAAITSAVMWTQFATLRTRRPSL